MATCFSEGLQSNLPKFSTFLDLFEMITKCRVVIDEIFTAGGN